MRRVLIVMAACLLYRVPLSAQDARQELLRDVVTVTGEKMVIEEYGLVNIAIEGYEPTQVQLKVHAEAPAAGVISRDNFVAMTTSMQSGFLIGVFAQEYPVSAFEFMQGFNFTQLEEAIGTPDLELNLIMTDQGIQSEYVNTATGANSRSTTTWTEMYGK